MSWKNPMEKREIKKPEPVEGETNVVDFEARAVIARDALANPIGAAPSSIDADALHRRLAEEEREQKAA